MRYRRRRKDNWRNTFLSDKRSSIPTHMSKPARGRRDLEKGKSLFEKSGTWGGIHKPIRRSGLKLHRGGIGFPRVNEEKTRKGRKSRRPAFDHGLEGESIG